MYNQSKDIMKNKKGIVCWLEDKGLRKSQHFVIFRVVLVKINSRIIIWTMSETINLFTNNH
uniref:Uncharacterized protein n=1 Tax=Arion vulgaris TaxID=1028688 RepID=A0A0B6ZE99_9EUPU